MADHSVPFATSFHLMHTAESFPGAKGLQSSHLAGDGPCFWGLWRRHAGCWSFPRRRKVRYIKPELSSSAYAWHVAGPRCCTNWRVSQRLKDPKPWIQLPGDVQTEVVLQGRTGSVYNPVSSKWRLHGNVFFFFLHMKDFHRYSS